MPVTFSSKYMLKVVIAKVNVKLLSSVGIKMFSHLGAYTFKKPDRKGHYN